jgi:hypothetical protein
MFAKAPMAMHTLHHRRLPVAFFKTWLWCATVALGAAPGCAHNVIAGTQAKDTPANREIYDVLVKLRSCLEQRDAATLMTLVSKNYFEDNGTPDPKDDYGYTELSERLAADTLSTAQEVSISLQIFDITVHGSRAWADLRYTSRARLELPNGRLWDSFRDFDRIEFVREDGAWRIIRGL